MTPAIFERAMAWELAAAVVVGTTSSMTSDCTGESKGAQFWLIPYRTEIITIVNDAESIRAMSFYIFATHPHLQLEEL